MFLEGSLYAAVYLASLSADKHVELSVCKNLVPDMSSSVSAQALPHLSGNSVFVVAQGKNHIIALDFSPFLPPSERPVSSASEDTQNLTHFPPLPLPTVTS